MRDHFPQHDIYDFRDTNSAFHWREVSPDWEDWYASDYLHALELPMVRKAFENDFKALRECDLVILLNQCGISAHIEAAWAAGKGKRVIDYYIGNNANGPYHHEFHIELMKSIFQDKAIGFEELYKIVERLV